MNELISVILPIYKVENYLAECIESVIHQTYENLEIILVDDGSPDRCGSICDEYAAKDSRIVVIHKENGGLSDARNAGIDIATGEWIAFVDSDDIINCHMIEYLYKAVTDNDAKMSWCAISSVDENGYLLDGEKCHYKQANPSSDYEINIYSKQDAEQRMYTVEGMQKALVAWNKLYHRSLFTNEDGPVRYAKGKIFEDGYTTYIYIYGADKVIEINVPLYYYRQRSGSIMDNDSNIKYEPALDAGLERMAFYKRHNEAQLYKLELNLSIYSVIRFYGRVKTKEDKKKLKQWFKLFYKDYFVKEKWPLGKVIRMKSFAIGYPCYKLISSFEGAYNKVVKK